MGVGKHVYFGRAHLGMVVLYLGKGVLLQLAEAAG